MAQILDDIEKGNINHKIFSHDKNKMVSICLQVNRIVETYRQQIENWDTKEQQYKQLLTNLSHDLRTPLASIIGYLEAIDEGYVSKEKEKTYIGIVRNKSYDLKKLIDELFEWFKLESKEWVLNLEPVEIHELTRSVLVEFIPIFEKQHIQYKIDISEQETFVLLYQEGYRRIIHNLIQNAILHSGGDEMSIGIRVNQKAVELQITDNGIGIEKEHLPYIFDRLYKCDGSRNSKGSGLGLYITKALVEGQNGEISVLSEPGKGTSFTVSFPRE